MTHMRHWMCTAAFRGCTIWCRSHNLTAPYSVREFMAAAVACGIKYSPLENFPHDQGRKDYLWRTQLEVVPWAKFNCQVFNRYAPSLTDYLSEKACLTYPSC